MPVAERDCFVQAVPAKQNRSATDLEKADNHYDAWSPDTPGCVAVADTAEEVEALMQESVAMHLAGMVEDGQPIPGPEARAQAELRFLTLAVQKFQQLQ